MAKVLWNGDYIYVLASGLNLEVLNKLAEKYNAEYSTQYNAFAFQRSAKSILDISKLEGAVFDKSFTNLLEKVQAAQKRKQDKIDALNLPDCMYPFQKEAVFDMLNNQRNILLASDPGCGKTMMSLEYLALHPNSYPALVVCPASLKVNWSKEVEKWTPDKSFYIVNGLNSFKNDWIINQAKKVDIIIVNYDILGIDDKEAQKREKQRIAEAKEEGRRYRKAFIPVSGWCNIFSEFNLKTIILDECQAIQTLTTVRTRAVIQMSSNQNIKKLFLSGTPFSSKVIQFYPSCHILAPDLFPNEWEFKQLFCNPKKGYGGHWTYNGLSNVEELRYRLSFFMIRHKKEDVLTQLPKKQKIPIYFDMEEKARSVYDQMEQELAEEKDLIHQFAALAKLKKALLDIKVEPVIQFIKDMLDVEEKLVIFVQHTEMFDQLMKTFAGQCAGINGGVPPMERQKEVEKFQNDSKIRLFFGQITAAGTGITLTASHVAIITEWGQNSAIMTQAEDRINRIGQEAERCLYYYLVVKDTIDEDPLSTLNYNMKNINAVLNGEQDTKLVDLDNLMIAKVKERRLMKNKKGVNIEYV